MFFIKNHWERNHKITKIFLKCGGFTLQFYTWFIEYFTYDSHDSSNFSCMRFKSKFFWHAKEKKGLIQNELLHKDWQDIHFTPSDKLLYGRSFTLIKWRWNYWDTKCRVDFSKSERRHGIVRHKTGSLKKTFASKVGTLQSESSKYLGQLNQNDFYSLLERQRKDLSLPNASFPFIILNLTS